MNNGAFGENFPYTNFHDLNLDWVIERIKKFSDDYENIDQYIQESVENYIEEHPDYRIEDESIVSKKLNKNSIPFYNVTDYDVIPNSGDVYRELHALIKDHVSNTGGILYFPKGRYTISYTVFIPSNTIVIGEGKDTEIYFDETDTSFGTALCNAGSNILITNITIGQRSTGVFGAGAQPGCIGFTNIAIMQCQEPAYSHNFIRESYTHDLTAENVYFNGFYPIQTEPEAGSVMENITYKNLTSTGCVSIQVGTNATVKNVIIENVTCDLIRYIIDGTIKNISSKNIITNSLVIMNNTDELISIDNLYETNTPKNNTIGTSLGVNYLVGNVNISNSVFDGCPSYNVLFYLGIGIRKWDRVTINCPSNQRCLSRTETVMDDTNYEIINDCNWTVGTVGSTVLIGYGKNNKFTGAIDNYLWGDAIRDKSLPGGGTTGSFYNYIYWNQDHFEIQLLAVPDNENAPNIYSFPSWFELPIDTTSGYVEILLYDYTARTDAVHSWGKIENKKLIITDNAYAGNMSSFNRILVKQELRTTRKPTMNELFNTFGA